MDQPKNFTGRKLLKLLRPTLESILITTGALNDRFVMGPSWVKVDTIRLPLKRLPRVFAGFRAAQISDIQMGGWMNLDRLQHVANLVIAQKPDVLLITGDFLIGSGFSENSTLWLNDLRKALSPLAQSIPSFAVLGNHDYWTNPEAIREMLSLSGITDLTNTVVTLTRDGNHLHLCGVDDIWEGQVRLDDVTALLSDNGASILLAHEPDYADVSAATGKFDLQISGHSHGGQITLPLYGPPVLPYLGRKYPRGLYKVGKMFQYTNRGVGMNRLAVRFNCPAEITLFELKSAQ